MIILLVTFLKARQLRNNCIWLIRGATVAQTVETLGEAIDRMWPPADLWAAGNGEAPRSLPVLGAWAPPAFPAPRGRPKDEALRQCCGLRSSSWHGVKAPVWALKTGRWYGDLLACSCPRQASCASPLPTDPAAYQPGAARLFVTSLPALCLLGAASRSHLGY